METSSYLPLLWRTPYTQSVIDQMSALVDDADFGIQADCIREASGYLSFEEDWKYQPAVRIRRLLSKTSDAQLGDLSFPSAAIQILLGGNIWPQGRYLNFVRHSVFFLSDLIDCIDFSSARQGLTELAEHIDGRIRLFRELFRAHESSRILQIPNSKMLPYWGMWYCPVINRPFEIKVLGDEPQLASAEGTSRDLFHFRFALQMNPLPEAILVADTGFRRQVRGYDYKLCMTA